MPGMAKRFKFLIEVEVDQDIIPGFGHTIRDWVNVFMQSSFFTKPQYGMTGRAFRLQAGDYKYVDGKGYEKPKAYYPIDLDDNKIDPIDTVTNRDGDGLFKLLEGAYGFCEATSFEQHSLWRFNNAKMDGEKLSWKQNNHGYLPTVGFYNEAPVCISVLAVTIDGKKIIFYHATSLVVEHDMVRAWLEKNAPESAREKSGRLNHTDANNFHNVLYKR